MKVEIWSDIACPWCYIGRRRIETAIDQFEHGDQVQVIWRSYQLDPSAPVEYDGSTNDMLMERYGMSRQQAEAAHTRVTDLATLEGLEYHMESAHPVNSLDAHRLIHLADDHGLQGEMKERLQRAYFTEGLVVSDHATLVKLGVEVGLDAEEIRQMLNSDTYTAEVHTEARRAQQMGSRGVPFFVFEEKYAVSGAQPTELFLDVLERTWTEMNPVVEIISGDDAGLCDDESCAV